MFLNSYFSCVEDAGQLQTLMQILDIWDNEHIFSKTFSDLLRSYTKQKVNLREIIEIV